MKYTDGYILPVFKNKLSDYRRMAKLAWKIWMDHGALEFKECAGDDINTKMGKSFKNTVSLKQGETVIFSWIVFKSRAHRDMVNAKVMKDPRMNKLMKIKMPFEPKRLFYGGFSVLGDL